IEMKRPIASAVIALMVITGSLCGGTITGITTTKINIPGFIDSATAGPDGNTWFLNGSVKSVGRITPAGALTMFPLPTTPAIFLDSIVAGQDGNLWFTENNT